MASPSAQTNTAALNGIVVDIADLQVSDDPASELVTYALGSCIAVCLHDSKRSIAGMIHYMLPNSKTSPEKAKTQPGMFANTGVPLLFNMMYEMGCKKDDLIVKVIGGGTVHDDKRVFDIGRRNYSVLRKIFWKNNVLCTAEDVGGSKSRTVRLGVASGEVRVFSKGEVTLL